MAPNDLFNLYALAVGFRSTSRWLRRVHRCDPEAPTRCAARAVGIAEPKHHVVDLGERTGAGLALGGEDVAFWRFRDLIAEWQADALGRLDPEKLAVVPRAKETTLKLSQRTASMA